MRSLACVLDENRGAGPGFDTLRVLLAMMIVCWHSVLAAYGPHLDQEAWRGFLGFYARPLLPMFFAISGFLVMGSAFRTQDVGRFVTLRALRIMPALALEITLSAVVLGTIFSTTSFWDYVTDTRFFGYFGSLVGRVRFTLPGLFETNPYPSVVNVALWTIPLELFCYVLLAILIFTNVFRQKLVMTAFVIALTYMCLQRDLSQQPYWMLEGRSSPQLLLASFAFGNLLYLWKDKIPYSAILFWAGLGLGLMTVRVVGLTYIASFCFTYCIVYLGLTPLPKLPVLSRGDYSYGIYLYGFPMQQLVTYLLPDMREWYWNIVLALPLAILMAMFSWTFVERPTLSLRKRLSLANPHSATERPGVFSLVLYGVLSVYGIFLAKYSTMLHSTVSAAITLGLLFAICSVVSVLTSAWNGKLSFRNTASVPERDMAGG